MKARQYIALFIMTWTIYFVAC